jgi:methyl-accepting chemotaxis protein
MIGKLLGNAQIFSQIIASQAGLSRDSQSDIRQLSELITNVTPPVTQPWAKAGPWARIRWARAFSTASSTRFDELLAQIEKLQAEYGLKLQDALGSSKAARQPRSLADSSRPRSNRPVNCSKKSRDGRDPRYALAGVSTTRSPG